MMAWFLRDPERLNHERAEIDKLCTSVDWLVGVEWCLDGALCLDAVLRAHAHDYEVRLSFPSFYPDAPPVVRPRNADRRWSSHQYGGADGPLCLEWGPDNWHSAVTAAQMLESVYRLLETENPLGEGQPEQPVIAPSRHQLTVGQALRVEWARWLVTNKLIEYMAAQPCGTAGSFKFSFRKRSGNWVALIHEATPLGGDVWLDDQVPAGLPGAEANNLLAGVWFKTDKTLHLGKPEKLDDLRGLLRSMDSARLLATDGSSPVDGFDQSMSGVLTADDGGGPRLFVVLSGESLVPCAWVFSGPDECRSRSPQLDLLRDKKIGIVGVGSAGSKIAISLARMGLRRFYLVDHDVMLPGNLQRHALDWLSVAQHKADALAGALGRIAPGLEAKVCHLHITGQESNAAVAGAFDRLAACDVLIDASACPRVFNLLSAIARTVSRPMLWLEVFAGGIGGMVARSRPGVDPTPQDMRGAYLQFCEDNPVPAEWQSAENYQINSGEGEILVASDADVSVIAHHCARLVPDCFRPPDMSTFPYSMYLIGLSAGWVFEAPFATIPISMEDYPIKGWGGDEDVRVDAQNADFLQKLLEKAAE